MNGYSSLNRGNTLRIGVDIRCVYLKPDQVSQLITSNIFISVMMNECVAAEQATPIYRHQTGGALRIFFFKLCKLLRETPAIVIFVFDGPDRPQFKHGRSINTHTIPEWVTPCKRLIQMFGFYCHDVSFSPQPSCLFLLITFRRPVRRRQSLQCSITGM